MNSFREIFVLTLKVFVNISAVSGDLPSPRLLSNHSPQQLDEETREAEHSLEQAYADVFESRKVYQSGGIPEKVESKFRTNESLKKHSDCCTVSTETG